MHINIQFKILMPEKYISSKLANYLSIYIYIYTTQFITFFCSFKLFQLHYLLIDLSKLIIKILS